MNELEMLAVLWGAEYFQNYVLGRHFLTVTHHKALVSLLNGNNKKNKTMFSRLTRRLDRLIPFDFQVVHKPGAKMGLADYLSRHPSLDAQPCCTYDSMFTVAKISSIKSALGFQQEALSKIDSSLHRLIILNAFVIYRIENNRWRANDHAVKIGPIAERRIAFPAGQLNLVEI